MNADPRVMEFFPQTLTREESDARVARTHEHFDRHGFGMCLLEVVGVADFAGFVGLAMPPFEASFTPCVEIGWRLAREHWGHGYATEAAGAALDFGFTQLQLNEVLAFTVPANRRSRRVMQRLGMTTSPAEDYDSPMVPEGHPLKRHVLYRVTPAGWKQVRARK
jgi:RimJ/RimL family protein N-acetyltransferase